MALVIRLNDHIVIDIQRGQPLFTVTVGVDQFHVTDISHIAIGLRSVTDDSSGGGWEVRGFEFINFPWEVRIDQIGWREQ